MTMFEVPKMSTHPLDKYRYANIDFISGSQIISTGILSGSTIQGTQITAIGTISGAIIQGAISGKISGSAKGTLNLAAESGSTPHGLGTTPSTVLLTISGAAATAVADLYCGTLTWAPSGSTGIWVTQTGSQALSVTWKAEL